MKRCLLVSVLALNLALLLQACASKPVSKPGRPEFLERGLVLQWRADSMLNLYENQPHTLLLCVYQLLDPNGFNQLRDDYAGLSKLLEGERFDASVATVKRVFIQPGEQQTLVLDRAEGARYVGVAAGYYTMDRNRATRLFEVPLITEQKGVLSRETIYRYGVLELTLALGPEDFQVVERKQGQ